MWILQTRTKAKGAWFHGTEFWMSCLKYKNEIPILLEIPSDRARRIKELTPGVMIIKMSKNGSFFLFFANDSKTLATVSPKHLSAPERSFLVLSENGMFNRFLSYCSWDTENRNIKKTAESAKK